MSKAWNPQGNPMAVVEDPSGGSGITEADTKAGPQDNDNVDVDVARYAALLEDLKQLADDETIIEAVGLDAYRNAIKET